MSEKNTGNDLEIADEMCEVCQVGAPQLTEEEIAVLKADLPCWNFIEVDSVKQLRRVYSFSNYEKALAFVNAVAEISEKHNHHPSMLLEWGKVTVTWWTHKINGLHRTDAIMAAKSDRLFGSGG